jgi:FkbM family methyltransferase
MKQFWTINKNGEQELRDLAKEEESWTYEKHISGECDSYNYMWHEMFNHYVHDDNGCDYERYGCYIKEGDVVLDIGGNIGVFAHRAEFRGASKVISFEPMTSTFNCLIKNTGPKTQVFKMAVGSKNEWSEFKIEGDLSNTGGSTEIFDTNREVVHREIVYKIDVNSLFNTLLSDRIDFMKVDIEGGEVELLNAISDENLSSLRCLSCEFHRLNDEFELFQQNFTNRMGDLGFKSFTLYHGDVNNCLLRTVSFWKE